MKPSWVQQTYASIHPPALMASPNPEPPRPSRGRQRNPALVRDVTRITTCASMPATVPAPRSAISSPVRCCGSAPGPATSKNAIPTAVTTRLFRTGAQTGAPKRLRAFSSALHSPLTPTRNTWASRKRASSTETSVCAGVKPPAYRPTSHRAPSIAVSVRISRATITTVMSPCSAAYPPSASCLRRLISSGTNTPVINPPSNRSYRENGMVLAVL